MTLDRPRSLIAQFRDRRHDLMRVGFQTAVATTATYLVVTHFGFEQASWAVIAALFTISTTADATYFNARGRITGALLGICLGFGAISIAPGATLSGLLVAVVTANLCATVWPSVRYGAATAAIVALEPGPVMDEALSVAGAVLVGTLIAAVTSFVIWPGFSRWRATHRLQAALTDCRDLIRDIAAPEPTDRRERQRLHARFLGHLEALDAEIGSTRFAPRLTSGVGLDDVARSVESLWHSLVMLDRAIASARGKTSGEALLPEVRRVAREAEERLADLDAAFASGPPARSSPAGSWPALSDLRSRAEALAQEQGRAEDREALHAVQFAATQIGASLQDFAGVAGAPSTSPPPR